MFLGFRSRGIASLALLSVICTAPGLAQDRDRDRARDVSADQDRVTDRDRIQDRDLDRTADRDQDRDRDRDQDRDQDRDRDPLYAQDRDNLNSRAIYGSELMTRTERREYRDRIGAMTNVQEWARYRAEHQVRMLARARERGVDLPAPLYGQQLMTDQERERLQERLQAAVNAQERQRIEAQNRTEMQERAREYQIPLSELGG